MAVEGGSLVLELRSEIPALHSEKERIEAACSESFRDVPGDWKIEIKLAHIASWWLIVIMGPDGFRESLLLDRHEQTATEIRARMKEILAER
jgi:hypothetical protein